MKATDVVLYKDEVWRVSKVTDEEITLIGEYATQNNGEYLFVPLDTKFDRVVSYEHWSLLRRLDTIGFKFHKKC